MTHSARHGWKSAVSAFRRAPRSLVAIAVITLVGINAAQAANAPSNPNKAPYKVNFPKGPFTLSPGIAAKLKGHKSLHIVMSLNGTSIPIFSAAMTAGFNRAVKADNSLWPVTGQIIGPPTQDYPTQVSQITALLNTKQIDCLVMHANEPAPFVPVINKAMAMGVPVFGVNADSPQSRRIAFFALDEYSAGHLAGVTVGQQIAAHHLKVTQAALVTGDVAGPWAQSRMKGFVAGLRSVAPSIKWANNPQSAIGTTFEPPKQYTAIRSYITGHPDVQLIFSTDQGVEMIAKSISDLHKTGTVFGAGFNVSKGILQGVIKGQLITTIGQGWNKQAEAAEHACVQFLTAGKLPTKKSQILAPQVITKANAPQLIKTVTNGGA